jgi:hypothetical protein
MCLLVALAWTLLFVSSKRQCVVNACNYGTVPALLVQCPVPADKCTTTNTKQVAVDPHKLDE